MSRSLTVVHVSTQRGWHGGEQQAALLVRGLRERGQRSIVFARRGGAFSGRLAAEGFEVTPFGGSGRNPGAVWQMRRRLRAILPDVIHFHDSHALTAGGLAAWRLPIAARVAARRVVFPIRSAWRFNWFADRVIAVSQSVAEVCRASGVEPRRIRVVHDGVDPSRARSGDRARGRQSLSLDDATPLVLCVASLSEAKGHTFLLQSLPAVLARHPQACLALAGDGPMRNGLAAQAKQLGVERAVRFLGYRDDVPDLLKAADLFVMPSLSEGMCSSLADAMFARTPLVTTAAGGIADIVGKSQGSADAVARIVPERDPGAMAAAIVAALDARESLGPMVDRAQARAERLFTADRMVEGTLAVYRELVGE